MRLLNFLTDGLGLLGLAYIVPQVNILSCHTSCSMFYVRRRPLYFRGNMTNNGRYGRLVKTVVLQKATVYWQRTV